MTPAFFLDRDGTLIDEVNYLRSPSQVRLVPGASAALARLNAAAVPVIVVTNQSGVARGYFHEHRVAEVHAHLSDLLRTGGARVDAYYYCPHHATDGVGRYRVDCVCRKPKPGMLLAAAAELGLDLSRSWMAGDKLDDLRAGATAGCQTVLVRTGYGSTVPTPLPADLRAVGVVADLPAAVDLWFARAAGRAGSGGAPSHGV